MQAILQIMLFYMLALVQFKYFSLRCLFVLHIKYNKCIGLGPKYIKINKPTSNLTKISYKEFKKLKNILYFQQHYIFCYIFKYIFVGIHKYTY